jgi:aquaporin Z
MADEPIETEVVEVVEVEFETRTVVMEPSGPSLLARLGAELAGTFILVLLGVGAALFSSLGTNGTLTVGLSFGVAVIIAAFAFGSVSGAHLNPAVTVGVWLSGRLPGRDVVPYILAQVVGGALAGGALFVSVLSLKGVSLAQGRGFMSSAAIGFGQHAPLAASKGLSFGLGVGIFAEIVATGLLVLVVLSATSVRAPKGVAPFAIGLGLALLVVWTIPFTNAALNPARATATAIFADNWALNQLWVWWLAPIVGAAIVGLAFRIFGPAEDLVAVASADSE